MLDIETVTSFLGWCAVINIGLLMFSAFFLTVFNTPVKVLHSKLIAVDSGSLNTLYFNFLGNYKIAVLVLNIVPYCALKIMA